MFVLYTNSVSAHQLPLARELVKRLGAENFRYVYTGENLQRGNQEVAASEPWIIRLTADESLKVSKFESLKVAGEGSLKVSKFEGLKVVDEGLKVSKFESLKVPEESASSSSSSSSSASTSKPLNLQTSKLPSLLNLQTSKPLNLQTSKLLSSCDTLLVGGLYPLELMEVRLAAGKKTLYMSERWFKPVKVLGFWLPGWLRMLHPGYFRRARRFAKMLRNPNYHYLPIGPWAAKDMRLVQRLTFCGTAANPFIPWAYFVAPSSNSTIQPFNRLTSSIRVLWVGRMLDWKCVDTLIRAVALASQNDNRFSLTLVGDGPERAHLEALAHKLFPAGGVVDSNIITFIPPVSLDEVRSLMRQHDVYVLPSNAYEGWGAALSEAMTEGMSCFGTYEAGASAALLPSERLFHAGDYRALAKLLANVPRERTGLPYDYTPEGAARRFESLMFDV